jgi:hypothetical protein
VISSGVLDRQRVFLILDHADDAPVARCVRAYPARFAVGYAPADGARADILLHFDNRAGKFLHLAGLHLEHMESEARSALRADAREP